MIKSVLKFLRLKILVTCYMLVFLGSAAAGSITIKTILAIFVLAAWYIHAASSNDYADRYIDKINLKNAKDRPLVTKDISHKQLWTIHYMAGAIALLLSCFYGTEAVVFTAVLLLLDYAYSFKPVRLSDRGIISQLTLPIAYVYYPFSLGYWSTVTPSIYPWLLSCGLYLGFVARLLLKDFRDVKGDRQYGKMTFLLRHGAKTTCNFSGLISIVALLIVCFAISPPLSILVVLIFSQIQVLIFLKALANTPKITDQKRLIGLLARVANSTIITLLAYYLCRNNASLSVVEGELITVSIGTALLLSNWLSYLDVSEGRLALVPSFLQHLAWGPLRLFMIVRCSLKIKGIENIEGLRNPLIIASNHLSELDPLIIVGCLPFNSPHLPLVFVSREKSFYPQNWKKLFYGGKFFRMMGAYPAYVGLNNYKEALHNHLEAIHSGSTVSIFPAGQKHALDDFAKAKGGVSYLSQKTQLPIIPVLIQGIGKYTFLDYLKGKSKLTVTFGKPLYSKDIFQKVHDVASEANRVDHDKAAALLMKKIAKLA